MRNFTLALLLTASAALRCHAETWVVDPPTPSAKVWVVSKSVCDCARTGVCVCDPATCDCGPGCVQHCSTERSFSSLKSAKAAALKRDQKLVLWVRGVCAPCVKKLSDCVHHSVDAWDNDGGDERVLVVVYVPDGDVMKRHTTFVGFPPVEAIQAISVQRRKVVEREADEEDRVYQISDCPACDAAAGRGPAPMVSYAQPSQAYYAQPSYAAPVYYQPSYSYAAPSYTAPAYYAAPTISYAGGCASCGTASYSGDYAGNCANGSCGTSAGGSCASGSCGGGGGRRFVRR